MIVSSGATASNVLVETGGTEIVLSGGVVSGGTTYGIWDIMNGGEAVSATVSNGATGFVTGNILDTKIIAATANQAPVYVEGSGVASNTFINGVPGVGGGGYLDLINGGTAINTLVLVGHVDNGFGPYASSGGTTIGTILINSGYNSYEFLQSGATSIGVIVSSGTTEQFTAGADVNIGATIMSGGTMEMNNGGTAIDPVLSPGAFVEIDNNFGVISGATVMSSASLVVAFGNTTFTTLVSSGGSLVVSSSSIATNTQVLSGGTAIILVGGTELVSAGTATNISVTNTGVEMVLAGGVAINTALTPGGLMIISSGGVGGVSATAVSQVTGTMTVTSGAELIVSGLVMPTGVVSGFTSGAEIDLRNIALSAITGFTSAGNTLKISAGGSVYSLNVIGIGSVAGGFLASDGDGGTIYEVCFAEGTHIMTPSGETAVEHLAVGDLVLTPDGAKPVTWLGSRSVDVATLRDPDMARLVRIKTGAFAAGIPHRDLLVTQEHCVFWEGKMIPARLLVNERSIIIDKTIASFTYYHVELERHGILFAEGLTTESYLDTGNRGNFANAAAVALQPDFSVDATDKTWAADAVAPLTVDRFSVEPVWRMLDERGKMLDYMSQAALAPVAFTHDPALHLATAEGLEIWPTRRNAGRYLFMVPAGASGLRLRSHAARPADTIGPFVDDRRMLGVKIGEVALWHGRKRSPSTAHLDWEVADGWFDIENNEPMRWTNGDASLPLLPNLQNKGTALLEINVVGFGLYAEESMRAA